MDTLLSIIINYKKHEYTINREGMRKVNRISPSALDLYERMLDMMPVNSKGKTRDDVCVRATYQDFGYEHRQHFYRIRKELVEHELIIADEDKYYINLQYVNCFDGRMMYWLRVLTGLHSVPVPHMEGKDEAFELPHKTK